MCTCARLYLHLISADLRNIQPQINHLSVPLYTPSSLLITQKHSLLFSLACFIMSKNFKKQDVFDRAISEAKKSCMTQKHSAVILKDGNIVSIGHNRVVEYMSHDMSLHAEIDALNKVKHKGKRFLEECTMVVIRIGQQKDGFPLKMSKPCDRCDKEIKKHGIRKVFYSSD